MFRDRNQTAHLHRSMLSAGAALLLLCPCRGADAQLDTLQRGVRKWLALRREIQHTRLDWQEQQRLLADELALHHQERKQLTTELREQTDAERAATARLELAQQRRDRLGAALSTLEQAVTKAEADLRTWPARLPPFLADPLRPTFAKLPARNAQTSPDELPDRLQVITGLYAQLHDMSRTAHVGRMVLERDGAEPREMDVLLLGLSMAYAVSTNDEQAAVSRVPAVSGTWTWEWRDELAPAVADALRCFRREQPARFVTLPVWNLDDAR